MLYPISLHLLSHFSSQPPKPPTTLELTSSILAQLRRYHGSFVCHLPHSSSLKLNPQHAATPPSSCLVLETEPRNPQSLLYSSRLIGDGDSSIEALNESSPNLDSDLVTLLNNELPSQWRVQWFDIKWHIDAMRKTQL
ncbi:hypothetical protein CFP56_012148 [Quercus suber]|uniref:Uncharacterized protein n=1 Tax=Quercus suber TaxID=58331 RepID=A0AAW0KVV2_QUESU